MTADVFTTAEVARATGVTYRQLDYWDCTKVVVPSAAPSSGPGTDRLYTLDDILRVAVIAELLSVGLNLQRAREAVDALRHNSDVDAEWIISTPLYTAVAADTRSVIEDLDDVASAVVVHLPRLRDRVERAVERLKAPAR